MFTSDHRIIISSTNESAGHISSQLATNSLTNARLQSKPTKRYAVNPPIPCRGVIHKSVMFASSTTQLLRTLHQLSNRLQRATTKLAQMRKGAASLDEDTGAKYCKTPTEKCCIFCADVTIAWRARLRAHLSLCRGGSYRRSSSSSPFLSYVRTKYKRAWL